MGLFGDLVRRFYPHYGGAVYVWPGPELGTRQITPNAADTLPPVMRAVTLLAGDVGRLPVRVQRDAGDAWESTESPVADLLATPNRWQSGFEWRRGMVRDLMLHGNACSVIRRTNAGEPLELVPLVAGSFTLHYGRDDDVHYIHPELGRLDPSEVLHFRLAGAQPLWGDSPIVRGRASLDLAAEIEAAGREHFRSGAIGKVALTSPDPIGEDAVRRLRSAFSDAHGRAGSLSTPIVAQGGMTVSTVGATLSQSEWIAARNYSTRQVAMLYGIPPQLLYVDEAGNVENTYTQLRAYVDGCLSHYLELFAGEVGRKLLPNGERLWFDVRHLLRGSLDQVVGAARNAIDAGVMTQNEARELLGLPPIDGGDVLVFSKNYAPGGMTDADAEAAAESEADDDPPTEEPDGAEEVESDEDD